MSIVDVRTFQYQKHVTSTIAYAYILVILLELNLSITEMTPAVWSNVAPDFLGVTLFSGSHQHQSVWYDGMTCWFSKLYASLQILSFSSIVPITFIQTPTYNFLSSELTCLASLSPSAFSSLRVPMHSLVSFVVYWVQLVDESKWWMRKGTSIAPSPSLACLCASMWGEWGWTVLLNAKSLFSYILLLPSYYSHPTVDSIFICFGHGTLWETTSGTRCIDRSRWQEQCLGHWT